MAVKRMGTLGVSVRKMTALPVMMETEILIGRQTECDKLYVLNGMSSKIYFIGKHLTSWVSN
jgi:hypothetical protein